MNHPPETRTPAAARRCIQGVVGFAGVLEPVTGETGQLELVESELVREAAWSLRLYDVDRDPVHLGRCAGALEAITLLRAGRR
jgi:hypothetical protein